MRIEIDQSGKIEQTQTDSILAFSNGKSYSILIKARTKRRVQELFRQIGEPETFVIYLFVIAIHFLIKDHVSDITDIIIDAEYEGKDIVIIEMMKLINGGEIDMFPDISICQIGKHSRAHNTAIQVWRKKRSANRVIGYNELKNVCFVNKNGYPALKYRLHTLR